MANRPATEIDVRNLWRSGDVRDELQILRKRIRARHQKHQAEAAANGHNLFGERHDQRTCTECWRHVGELQAVNEAIRLFGGRVAEADQP